MISTEIYIEDEKLDLVEDILTEFTYTIDDIADFGQKILHIVKQLTYQVLQITIAYLDLYSI